jgi:hypothetical protein
MKRLVGLCVLSAACTTGAWNGAHAQSMEARQLIQATNEDRAQQGLGPLKWDPALARSSWCGRAPYRINMRGNLIW